jgi:glycosyltransferase involved in cell wall biosynthesis
MVRVLYFSRDYSPHDHRFLSALSEHGQAVWYLRLEQRGRRLETRPLPKGVSEVPWPWGERPFAWRQLPARTVALRRILRQLQPEVVHAGPVQTCAFLAARAGAHPLVSMSWGSDMLVDARANRWLAWVTAYTLRRSEALVGDCAAVQHAAESFGFPPQRVTLFPWGIDLQAFRPAEPGERELRAALGWEDCFVALSLRSWEPIYGVDVVVRGFARAAAEEPRLRLLLLSGGSLEGAIRRLIEQSGLGQRVHVVGPVAQAELARYYHAADLYLSASHSDGSSVSLLEALGCGLPALVSDIPGNREWITPGEAGWLFTDGDDQRLAEGLLQAARTPAARLAEMSRTARRLAEERANWYANFPRLLVAYQMAIQYRTPKGVTL